MLRLSPAVASALALAIFAAAAPTQGRNVTVLSQVRINDPRLSDVWGHYDPATGTELALVFGTNGTYVYDATDPSSPALLQFFPNSLSGWAGSRWRDGRTYRGYLYVVTEGGGGMQIFDLRVPTAPRFVKTFTVSGWRNTHNVGIDAQRGYAFPCGIGGIGTLILDIATDPENPREIGRYTGDYVHDVHVQDGLAHFSEINRANYRLVDAGALPATPTLGTARVTVSHSGWPTRDNRYFVATSETGGVGMTILDIQNRSNPVSLGTWRTGSSGAVIHNTYLRDRVVHIAYNSEGYQSVDLTDPNSPTRVAWYDTTPTSTRGFIGTWGCYPFQPSGVIYMSDRLSGLFILDSKSTTELYGRATPASATPTVHTFGAAWLGNSNFGLEIDDAAPNAQAWFVLGLQRASVSFQGLEVLVEPTSILTTFATATDGAGEARVPVPVPNVAALDGALLHVQALVLDAPGPLGLSASRGMALELFSR